VCVHLGSCHLFLTLETQYDRKWCIIDDRSHRILTQRDLPQMVRIVPEIDRAAGLLRVSFPPDAECEAFDAQLDPPSAETAEWQLYVLSRPFCKSNAHAESQHRRDRLLLLVGHRRARRPRGRRVALALPRAARPARHARPARAQGGQDRPVPRARRGRPNTAVSSGVCDEVTAKKRACTALPNRGAQPLSARHPHGELSRRYSRRGGRCVPLDSRGRHVVLQIMYCSPTPPADRNKML
jgi:hypothetical protein